MMKGILNRIRKGYRGTAKRLFAALVSAALLVTGTDMTAFASETSGVSQIEMPSGTAVSNAYILEVSTGLEAGDEVEYFIVKYRVSGSNTTYNQYLFPQEDSYSIGNREVASYGSDESIAQSIQSNIGYVGQTDWKGKGAGASLKAYHTDQFYFTTSAAISSIISVDAFFGKSGTWTCQAIRVFQVSQLYGLRMAGVWSDTWYIDFEGKLMAETQLGKYSWSKDGPGMLHLDQFPLITDFSGKSYATHTSQANRNYGFRVDFANSYGSGFECLAMYHSDGARDALSMQIAEVLTFNITYTDVYGQTRFVHFPATTSTAYYLNTHGASGNIYGIAQQGESIGFTGEIPDCQEITAVNLSVGQKDAIANAYIKSADSKSIRARRETASDSDVIRTTCVAIYDMHNAAILPSINGAAVEYEFQGQPILYKAAGSYAGVELSVGSQDLGISRYDGRAYEYTDQWEEQYLVQIQTDDVAAAATTEDLTIQMYYTAKSGRKVQTDPRSVKELVHDYTGYWPGSVDDFAYRMGTTKGQTLSFILSADKVEQFTGLKLGMASGTDEFQFSGIKIFNLSTAGKRHVVWEEVDAGGGISSHVRITRVTDSGKELLSTDAAVPILDIDRPSLILPGEDQTVDFESNSITGIEDSGFDVLEYALSYEEAMQNFGFNKTRMSYDVTVKVVDDVVGDNAGLATSGGNGDSGSRNHFYFQLIFDHGTSAYVNANDQLQGDSFKTGDTATFRIRVNQDYGEIVAVRIIPDESEPDGDADRKYDKLQVEKIYVTEGNVQGTHKQWECRNVGWIGVDYTDPGAQTSAAGRKGRTFADTARTFMIDYTTSCVDIEVALRTSAGDKGMVTNLDGNEVRKYSDQFKGSIAGYVWYIDTDGFTQRYAFDVVEKMYEYMKRTPTKVGGAAVSDPTIMFREGHTDRFVLSIPDVRTIKAFEFEISCTTYPYLWNIGGISGKIVKDEGRLRINVNDEYQYEREEEAKEPLFTQDSEDTPAYHQILTGTTQNLYMAVTDNKIELDRDLGTANALTSRVPVSQDDTVNVFVFPSHAKATYDSMSSYDLNVTLQYAHASGAMYEIREKGLSKYYGDGIPEEEEMFYVTGLSASGMIDLNRMYFEASAETANMCFLDHAIVQQIRAETVVATYYFGLDPYNDNAFYPFTRVPTSDQTALGYTEDQEVVLQFGVGTEEKGLFPAKQDIAVAIGYTASFAPNGREYRSPYVYLTDQDINKIREGQVIDLKFHQSFIGSITGIYLQASGSVEAYAGKAIVKTYQTPDGGERSLSGWYSFGKPMHISGFPLAMERTADTVDHVDAIKPLELTFETSAASSSYESGTTDPVRAVLTFEDAAQNTLPSIEIADLRTYLTDGNANFLTGQRQTVKLLVSGAANFRRIELEPKNGNGTAGWSLKSVSAKLGDADAVTRTVDARIYEGTPSKIIFANVTVNAVVHNYNDPTKSYDEHRVTNGSIDLIVLSGRQIYITPTVSGSDQGCSVYAVEVSDGTYVSGRLEGLVTFSEGRYVFQPPRNTSGKTKYYRLIAESAEQPSSSVVVNITIESEKEETQNEQSTGQTPGAAADVSGNGG
ncbi:MAG: hypothetical protein IKS07_07650 [Lachnospiraceae bacterium]|nr:hypothetical protein [Lachnospiraceae bacterium]